MSRKNRYFNPRSLRRVATAVEWEDDLHFYVDGTTNQEMYLASVALLWERWVRGWSLPDLLSALADSRSRQGFAEGVKRIIDTIPERVMQLRGFYEGLWWGANPNWVGPAPKAATSRARIPGQALSEQESLMYALQEMLAQLRNVLE